MFAPCKTEHKKEFWECLLFRSRGKDAQVARLGCSSEGPLETLKCYTAYYDYNIYHNEPIYAHIVSMICQ
ncbi:hypothetical protein VN97_g958 [Penicillium thymicola]|uniref:Uncharacterized protein n=1 Tax=Penicillium thymicola TaxID=293382 RepID=A0AAI9XCU3_PENTH|nr:hypothetical protein VN97_g958 [Penicillium thymicola]